MTKANLYLTLASVSSYYLALCVTDDYLMRGILISAGSGFIAQPAIDYIKSLSLRTI